MKSSDSIRLLLLSQDVNYATLLAENLSARHLRVDNLSDGGVAVDRLRRHCYDICIVDANAARPTALQTVRTIREYDAAIPVLLLSGKNDTSDVIEGYVAGCSEYVLTPCAVDVMVCKIESWNAMSNTTHSASTTVAVGSFILDVSAGKLTRGTEVYKLPYRQAAILQMLAENPNRLVERRVILRRIWHDDSVFAARSLNVYLYALRKVVEQYGDVKIVAVRNKGYRLETRADKSGEPPTT